MKTDEMNKVAARVIGVILHKTDKTHEVTAILLIAIMSVYRSATAAVGLRDVEEFIEIVARSLRSLSKGSYEPLN
jgi:hypothetical protein